MNDLERMYWLGYQERLPSRFSQFHERITRIIDTSTTDAEEVDKVFKIMTLNDLLRVAEF